jgi:hypothetical protein
VIKFRLFALPFLTLLCCLLASCRPPPLMSYPRFWDYARAKPKESDLPGRYKILKIRLSTDLAKQIRGQEPSLKLNADHTALLANFPRFDGFGDRVDCSRSGIASWSLHKDLGSSGWQVAFEDYRPSMAAAACGQENSIWPVLLLGQKPPYRFYLTVGDPDSDTGIEFQKAAR